VALVYTVKTSRIRLYNSILFREYGAGDAKHRAKLFRHKRRSIQGLEERIKPRIYIARQKIEGGREGR
jgi:hypothetical protein